VYEVPVNFEKDGITDVILRLSGLKSKKKDITSWEGLVRTIQTVETPVKIGIVGKYFQTGDFTLADSYISVIEAVKHAAWAHNLKPDITWLNAEAYEQDKKKLRELERYDGIIVPGGFGPRGVEGKILAIRYAREHDIPYFGLCYGMQLATVEFARHVAGMADAHTTEVNPQTSHPVITPMAEQEHLMEEKHYGGSMRLGAYQCALTPDTVSFEAYKTRMMGKTNIISERHRHRYEFNNLYRKQLEDKGLVVAGINSERNLVEIIELKGHPFFVGTQFHPEFKSRPIDPHPLYMAFIAAAKKRGAGGRKT
jgi:CTP synthase